MDEEIKNKKGQIAIWVILALVLAGVIILFAVINRPSLTTGEQFDPQKFIEECTREVVAEAADKMMPQGGFLEPKVFKVYNDTKVAYLCKSEGYYVQCVNLHPMLMTEIMQQIKNYSEKRIASCFDSMKTEAEKRGATVEMGEMNLTIALAPRTIYANIAREVKITEGGTQRVIQGFKVETSSPIYDLALVAINIANNERKYCYFEYVGYMALDKNVAIRKDVMSDSTIIYSIKYVPSGDVMNIATRSCAIPAGL